MMNIFEFVHVHTELHLVHACRILRNGEGTFFLQQKIIYNLHIAKRILVELPPSPSF